MFRLCMEPESQLNLIHTPSSFFSVSLPSSWPISVRTVGMYTKCVELRNCYPAICVLVSEVAFSVVFYLLTVATPYFCSSQFLINACEVIQ